MAFFVLGFLDAVVYAYHEHSLDSANAGNFGYCMTGRVRFMTAIATFDVTSRKVVSATSDVASELPADEQVVCRDLTRELSNSLSGIRKEMHKWNAKCRHVIVNRKPKSSTVVCCHVRELCGFVHGDDFIIAGGFYAVDVDRIEAPGKVEL